MPRELVGSIELGPNTCDERLFAVIPFKCHTVYGAKPRVTLTWFSGQKEVTYSEFGLYAFFLVGDEQIEMEFTPRGSTFSPGVLRSETGCIDFSDPEQAARLLKSKQDSAE